jgi:hypothetical protein
MESSAIAPNRPPSRHSWCGFSHTSQLKNMTIAMPWQIKLLILREKITANKFGVFIQAYILEERRSFLF